MSPNSLRDLISKGKSRVVVLSLQNRLQPARVNLCNTGQYINVGDGQGETRGDLS